MEKKYELTNETIIVDNITLYRIKAVKDFDDVKAGDLGGYIEKEDNLSHEGNCWVYNNAKVYDKACVFENAKIYDNAKVFNITWIFGDAKVYDNAKIYGDTKVCDNAKIYDNTEIFGNAEVYDNAWIIDDVKIFGNAKVFGNTEVRNCAKIYGDAKVYGKSDICGNAIISNSSDYIVFKNWWSSGRYFTWTKSNNMWKVGCFYGTGEELIKKAYKDSEISGREYEKIVNYVNSIINSND